MSTTAVDVDVEQLLVDHVTTFEKLELLALACRHRTVWSSAAASTQLRVAESLVETALAELAATGLLARDRDGYRFPSTGSELEKIAQRLCDLYDQDRLVVLNLLTAASFKRIRMTAARTFADAFRFRKPDPDDPTGGGHG
jgi:hypothetical protein